jgi:hypothetical protein
MDDLGWVDFGTSENPQGPVNVNLTTGVVTGKAYVENTGEYIYFNASPYNSNVTVNLSTGVVSGYAWSADVGWINFGSPGVLLSNLLTTSASTLTSETSITYGGSAGSAKIVATNDSAFVQNLTLPDTGSYTLSANVYTNGSAVTAANTKLLAGTNPFLVSTYTPLTGGWYKMTAVVTGVTSAQPYGVFVPAGQTVYVDNLSLIETSNAAVSSLAIQNTLTGLGQLSVESTATLNSGLASLKALIVKGTSGQSINLQEWQNASGTALTSLTANGLLNATTGGLATFYKATSGVNDSSFVNPVNGLLAVNNADSDLYVRAGGTWHIIAFNGGFQIPAEEVGSLVPGDYLIPYVESQMESGNLHGLYAKFSDVKGQLFASESAQIASISAELANPFQNLEADGAVTLKSTSTFNGPAIFQGIADLFDKVIFHQDATFSGNVAFDADTAGVAVIPTGSTETNVTFVKAYDTPPVVTAFPTNASALNYIIAKSSVNGFTIILDATASADVKFAWNATEVSGAKTTVGATPSPTP